MGGPSKSPYVCERCDLPLQSTGTGYRHAVNGMTKGRSCGQAPVPVKRGDRPLRPGMRLTVWRPAGTVTVEHHAFRQRFGACTFDYLIGTVTPLRREGETVAYAVVTAAEVARDGSGVLLHLEVIDFGEAEAA